MSRKSLVPVNFLARSTDPSRGVLGDAYYNTQDNALRTFDGTQWNAAASSGGGGGDNTWGYLDGGAPLDMSFEPESMDGGGV